jgi:SAM-dependent methyltransferase
LGLAVTSSIAVFATGKNMSTRTFDRTRDDVAKLVGCNTRNVQYRWSIFDRNLKRIPQGARVLDFGAGSLRETYELTAMGFEVTAMDRDEETLRSYYADYEWRRQPEVLIGDDLSALQGRKFALVTAFDVFEHLNNPAALLAQMRTIMTDGAMIFCTVPNRRTIWEIALRANWKLGVAMGKRFTPGEPHIQFKSPKEWWLFFEGCGFTVVAHEMAIGFFVNTWSAVVEAPTRLLGRMLRMMGLRATPRILNALTGRRVMAVLDAIDRRTPFLRGLYGWNLFVLA